MSYATMDHAGWVQEQIPRGARPASKRHTDVRKGWAAAPDTLTEFHAKVFDILGMVYGGIYNAPICWDAVQWRGYSSGIAVPVRAGRSFSTFDFAHLTRFVFLCHEARIRGAIEAHGPGTFLLTFFERQATGGMSQRHPNIDEAVAEFRGYLPQGHRILFAEAAAADLTPSAPPEVTTDGGAHV